MALVDVHASPAIWPEHVASVATAHSSFRPVLADLLAASVPGVARVHHLHLDFIARPSIGGQLVPLIARTRVRPEGVVAPLTARARRLALVLVGARALVVLQLQPPRTRASRLTADVLAQVLTSSVFLVTRVGWVAASLVRSEAVSRTTRADDATPLLIAQLLAPSVPHVAPRPDR